jgi:hypothetical protein
MSAVAALISDRLASLDWAGLESSPEAQRFG